MLLHYIQKSMRNIVSSGIGSLIARMVSFLFLPYFLSRLALHELGTWDFYQNYFSLGTVIFSPCATISLTRFSLLYKANPQKQNEAIGNACLLSLVGILLLFSCYFVSLYFGLLDSQSAYNLMIVVNISLFLLFALTVSYVRMQEKLLTYTILLSFQTISSALITVLGVWHGLGIQSFFYANGLSLVPFIPFFFSIFFRHYHFSFSLLKQQIAYSAPLLISGFLFNLFYVVDRWFLQKHMGFEALGWYSLLWKFGGIYQLFSATITDVRPIIFFNAQQEIRGREIINSLITYFCFAFVSGCLVSIIVARLAIGYFLPTKYHTIISVLPLFFSALTMLNIAQTFNTGCALAKKTTLLPVIVTMALLFQVCALYLGKWYTIESICYVNLITFCLYALMNYSYASHVYDRKIIDLKKIVLLLALFFSHIFLLQLLFFKQVAWYYLLCAVLISWPFSIFMVGLFSRELQAAKVYSHYLWSILIKNKKGSLKHE